MKEFRINITFLGWLLGLKGYPAPFELRNDTTNIATTDLAQFTAHEYACLNAYPGKNKNLDADSQTHPLTILDTDADYQETSPSKMQNKYCAARGTVTTQIEHTQVTWSPSSALEYLISFVFYSFALKRIQKDTHPLWTLPLFLAWGIYTLIDALRFVGALIFSPIGFSLTFILKNTRDVVRLAGTWVHYNIAAFVNYVPNILSPAKFDITKHNEQQHQYHLTHPNFCAGNIDNEGNLIHHGTFRDLSKSIHDFASKHSRIMTPPSIEEAFNTFDERINKNWEDSLAYFSPVRQKLEPVFNHMQEKANSSPTWAFATICAGLFMLATVAFLDYVTIEVLTYAIESRPFGTSFFDQIGGGYAEIAGKHVSHWATLSWDKIEIGMQFFIHYLVNKAIVPALHFLSGGASIPHTSMETCRFVGGIFFMTLIPLLSAFGIYKKMNNGGSEPLIPLINSNNNANANTNSNANTNANNNANLLIMYNGGQNNKPPSDNHPHPFP